MKTYHFVKCVVESEWPQQERVHCYGRKELKMEVSPDQVCLCMFWKCFPWNSWCFMTWVKMVKMTNCKSLGDCNSEINSRDWCTMISYCFEVTLVWPSQISRWTLDEKYSWGDRFQYVCHFQLSHPHYILQCIWDSTFSNRPVCVCLSGDTLCLSRIQNRCVWLAGRTCYEEGIWNIPPTVVCTVYVKINVIERWSLQIVSIL